MDGKDVPISVRPFIPLDNGRFVRVVFGTYVDLAVCPVVEVSGRRGRAAKKRNVTDKKGRWPVGRRVRKSPMAITSSYPNVALF